MNSIGLLSGILASRNLLIRGAAFGSEERLAPLIAAGILLPAGHVASVLCTECETPHVADIESAADRPGWYCLEAGFVPAESVSISAFQVRIDVLAEALRTALGTTRPAAPAPTDVPRLWSIGSFDLGEFSVAVCFAPNLADASNLNELVRYLSTPRGHPHGSAILTNESREFGAILLPNAARIIPLGDVCSLNDDGCLAVDRNDLARRALPNRLLHPPQPGRPRTKRDRAREVLADLDSQGKLDGLSERAQYQMVRTELRNRNGDKVTLAKKTFVDALSEYRAKPYP